MGIIRQPKNLAAHAEDDQHPKGVVINDWRYIKYDYFQGRREIGKGCYILVRNNLYFIPGILPEQVVDISNSDDTLRVFFFRLKHGAAWCPRCQGAGKLNWIENAKGGVPYQYDNQHHKEFSRDHNSLLAYSRRTSHCGKYRTLFLAPSIVKRGEVGCFDCRGTGLWLNATVHLFQGFPKIKSKIVYEKGGFNKL